MLTFIMINVVFRETKTLTKNNICDFTFTFREIVLDTNKFFLVLTQNNVLKLIFIKRNKLTSTKPKQLLMCIMNFFN